MVKDADMTARGAPHPGAERAALRGKRALITGAGSGIGRAMAIALAGAGATVSLLGRNQESLKATGKLCESAVAECWPVDLSDPTQVGSFARQFEQQHGSLDILVHAAGVFARGRL